MNDSDLLFATYSCYPDKNLCVNVKIIGAGTRFVLLLPSPGNPSWMTPNLGNYLYQDPRHF